MIQLTILVKERELTMKRYIALLLAVLLCFTAFAACSKDGTTSGGPAANVLDHLQNKDDDDKTSSAVESSDESSDESAVEGESSSKTQITAISKDELVAVQNDEPLGYQLEAPAEGEEIAVFTMDDGSQFKLRFFADEAPKTVYNFKLHALNGYYDGLTFHRIIQNFMIQGGDPLGEGYGGESVWEDSASFEDEFSPNLVNINGSVAMANSGANTNGSQFFINNTETTEVNWEYYNQMYDAYKQDPETFASYYSKCVDMEKVTDEYKSLYNSNGGNPNLDGSYSTDGTGHTVFAQVFEGMDVVSKIAATEVDANNNYKPFEDCIIKTVEIVKYKG